MRRIHALVLVPLIAFAACSAPAATTASPAASAPASSAPASSAPASSAPATTAPAGDALTGDGYTLTLPEGWKDATADFKKLQPQVDTGAKKTTDIKDGFNDNVNVIAQTSGEVSFDSLRDAIKTQLEGAGSTNIEFKETVRLDGRLAMQVWSNTKDAGDAHTIQFMTFNNGKLFVLTVSTNLDDAAAAGLAQEFVSGWKWAA